MVSDAGAVGELYTFNALVRVKKTLLPFAPARSCAPPWRGQNVLEPGSTTVLRAIIAGETRSRRGSHGVTIRVANWLEIRERSSTDPLAASIIKYRGVLAVSSLGVHIIEINARLRPATPGQFITGGFNP